MNKLLLSKMSEKAEKAIVAGGCFWGIQHLYDKHFPDTKTRVGYIGGLSETPVYEQVCSGTTGHAEAVEISYDPAKTSYEKLITFFFHIHDPTQVNRQGPDVGTQYRTGIFYHGQEQKSVAEKVKAAVQMHFKRPVMTEIVEAGIFYDAEEYHQKYLKKNPGGYECPTHYYREFK